MILTQMGQKYRYVLVSGGGSTPILYNRTTLELIEACFKVYPETVPGYDGIFNNVNSKSYTIGAFRIKESGRMIVFATTHLWWMSGVAGHGCYRPYSNEAREYQMNLMLDAVEEFRLRYNCPAIISGDFNDDYNSLAVSAAKDRGYRHAHDIAVDFADERDGYHYCFPDGYDMYENPKPFEAGIDHILVKGEPQGFVRRFERFTPEWYMTLSDHFPAYIDVEL